MMNIVKGAMLSPEGREHVYPEFMEQHMPTRFA